MADIFSKDRLGSNERHRADDIHIHQQEKKLSAGPLIGLGALALGLFALWGYVKNSSGAPGVSCGQTTVQFSQYGAALSAGTKTELAKLASCLKAHPSEAVSLEGRADPSELSYNSSLAQGRADALAAQLGALGVPASQFAVATNLTPCAESGGKCQTATATARPAQR